MASNREWAAAYLEQAKEDLRAVKEMRFKVPSVFCMLMQMVYEKASKSALLVRGQMQVKKANSTHAAASKMVSVYKRHGVFIPGGGLGKHYNWNDVLPIVTRLERAQPALARAKGPVLEQLEYPWENSSGQMCVPARNFSLITELNGKMVTVNRLVKFADGLISDIEGEL